MTNAQRPLPDAAALRQKALARWDGEGGAGPEGPQMHDPLDDRPTDPPAQSPLAKPAGKPKEPRSRDFAAG